MRDSLTLVPFGWPVVLYLTLAGIAAGAALTGAWSLLRGGPERRRLGLRGLLVAALAIAAGAASLIADLEAPSRFLLILTQFNPASIIAWGARWIIVFGLLAFYSWWAVRRTPGDSLTPGLRLSVALTGLFALGVGLYPAWVLGQAVARPLWGSPWIAPLFLISAVHTGLAALLLWRPRGEGEDGRPLPAPRLELALILGQMALLAIYLLTVLPGYGAAAARMTRGDLAPWLWGGVIVAGWLIPLAFVSTSDRGKLLARATAVLVGGLSLRALIVFGGQGSAALLTMSP